MIRGSAFSAILHGLLLAGLIFGLPHLMLLVDEPLKDPPHIEVVTITPEEAEAVGKAAARPLQTAAPDGGPNGLMADAVNTETPEDRRTKLQSAAVTNVLTQAADDEISEQAPAPDRMPRQSAEAKTSPPAQRPDMAATAQVLVTPRLETAPRPERALRPEVASVQQPTSPPSVRDTPAAPTALLPPRPPVLESSASTTAAEAAEAATQSLSEIPESASSPQQKTPTSRESVSGAALLAESDDVVKAIEPMVAALPRLDETLGEIFAAAARDPTAAAAAAESTPALQQSIERMESAAEQGYAHAQFALAEIYLTGNGRPRDIEAGKKYLERASMNGYVPAQLLTAALAVAGGAVPRDLAESHAWLSLAADQGNKQASEALERIERQMNPRDDLRARQRRSQLRQLFVLSNPKPDDPIKRPPREDQLRIATTLGDVEAVYVSLAQGSDANKPDEDGRTAAIEAAWRGYGKILKALLEQGADVRAKDGSGKNALMWAAINGHADVAEQLIAADIPVNAQDQDGLTALMRAAWNGHADLVKLLLQRKANPSLRDRSGKTALDYATQSRQAETVRLLRAASRS